MSISMPASEKDTQEHLLSLSLIPLITRLFIEYYLHISLFRADIRNLKGLSIKIFHCAKPINRVYLAFYL